MTEKHLNRLREKIDALEHLMALDYESAVIQLVEHREDLHGKVRESVEGLEEMVHLGEEKMATIRRQLEAVETRLSQRSAELLAEWQQDRRQLRESLHALELLLEDFEKKEDERAVLYFRPLSEKARRLEDWLDGLRVQSALRNCDSPEELEDTRRRILEALSLANRELHHAEEAGEDVAEKVGHLIHETSEFLWEALKLVFYYEENERDRERKRLEGEGMVFD